MSKMKKCQVVMLPTNEKAEDCLLLSKNSKDIFYKKGYFTQSYLTEIGRTAQHLYILSDDKIKESDWYYTPKNRSIEQCVKQKLVIKGGENDIHQLKIIATTDKSIILLEKFPSFTYLPQPSKSFIEKYIEEFNKGNIIKDVLVEYESVSSFSDIEILNKPFETKLKVNPKDNTITIKKVKDSWSREEVIEIIKIIKSHSKESVEKWIEENF